MRQFCGIFWTRLTQYCTTKKLRRTTSNATIHSAHSIMNFEINWIRKVHEICYLYDAKTEQKPKKTFEEQMRYKKNC